MWHWNLCKKQKELQQNESNASRVPKLFAVVINYIMLLFEKRSKSSDNTFRINFVWFINKSSKKLTKRSLAHLIQK